MQVLNGPRRGVRYGGRDLDLTAVQHYHGCHTGGFGGAQQCAKVLRVLYRVEHQYKRILPCLLAQLRYIGQRCVLKW